jgi:hypothetical protein
MSSQEVHMKIAIIAVATVACTTICAVAQAHTPSPIARHGIHHHAVQRSVSERRNLWPDMTTGSSMQRDNMSSWHTGIEQMDSTPSGE